MNLSGHFSSTSEGDAPLQGIVRRRYWAGCRVIELLQVETRIGNDKSASVHECVRSNRYDLLGGMSLDENRGFREPAPTASPELTSGSLLGCRQFFLNPVKFRWAFRQGVRPIAERSPCLH